MSEKVMMVNADPQKQFVFVDLQKSVNEILGEILGRPNFDWGISLSSEGGTQADIFRFQVESKVLPACSDVVLMDPDPHTSAWFGISCSYKYGKWGYTEEYILVPAVTCAIARLTGQGVQQLDEMWIDQIHFDEKEEMPVDQFLQLFLSDPGLREDMDELLRKL